MFSKRQIRKRYRKKNSRQHIGDIDFLVKQQIHTHQKDKHQADKRHVGGGCCRDKSGKKHRRKRDKTLKNGKRRNNSALWCPNGRLFRFRETF